MKERSLKCRICGATGKGIRFVRAKPLYTDGFRLEPDVVCFSCYGLDYDYDGDDIDEITDDTDEIKIKLNKEKKNG